MEVQHEPGKFFVKECEDEAVLLYRQSNGTIDIYHTFAPEKLRGRGIAARLMQAAIDYAKENNLKVIPTCTYAQKFMERK